MIRAIADTIGSEIDAEFFLYRLLYLIPFVIIAVIFDKLIAGYVKKRAEREQDSSFDGKDAEASSGKDKTDYLKDIGNVAKILIIVIFFTGKYLLFEGQSLPHKPGTDDVSSVVVEYRGYSGEAEEYDDELIVKAAVAILNDLDYDRLKKAPEGDPIVKVTYIKNDKTTISVEANNETVWWRGKAYAIKDEAEFIDACGVLFKPVSDEE